MQIWLASSVAGMILLIIFLIFLLTQKFPVWQNIFIYLTSLYLLVYLAWRGFSTLNFSTISGAIVSLALFLSEAIGALVFVIFSFLFTQKIRNPKIKDENDPSLESQNSNKKVDEIQNETSILAKKYNLNLTCEHMSYEHLINYPQDQPWVDIFICTYNEDIGLVLTSALAAANLPYTNKKVFICDDGHRPELAVSAEKFQLGYISRTDNEHAKAGNINYALAHTQGEFFLVLDADFIVKEKLLLNAIPFLGDPKVALVQYPQSFYNKDPFQLLNDKYYNEQDFFMRFIEPRLSKHNAIIHIGTNAVIRRSAIEEIGGIPTATITEDMATGLLLQDAGYRTLYVNKAYAFGIAPYNLKDLKIQRQRWARGTIQTFKAFKPFRAKHLNLKQKTFYFNILLYWFTSFQKLCYMIAPSLYLGLGILSVRLSVEYFLMITLPALILLTFSFRIVVGKARTFNESHIYDTLVAPFHASAILKELIHKEKKFKVTPKVIKNKERYDFKTITPHIVLAVWLIFCLIISTIKLLAFNGIDLGGYLICAFWTLYNLYALVNVLRTARPHYIATDSDALSISIDENVLFEGLEYKAFQMSFNGFRIYTSLLHKPKELNLHQLYSFTIPDTQLNLIAELIEITQDHLSFKFNKIDKDTAYLLAKFYATELHAAKPIVLPPLFDK